MAGPHGPHLRYLDLEGPWPLELGGTLPRLRLAYETYGRLSPAGDNAILVCHALTGDAHPAAHGADDAPGWWEGLVGPGCAVDTRRWFVICSNVLGGCRGSTGPLSTDPETGRPYGLRFPVVTVADMVRAQRALLDRLGIRRLALVVGGSLGGMQALAWALLYPERVARVAVIAAPWASSPLSIAWNEIGRQAILLDPEFRGGDYPPGRGPARGLAVARMLGMVTYRSLEHFAARFGRQPVPPGTDPVEERAGDYATRLPAGHPFGLRFQIESYLHYQGEKLVRRFDANSYLYLTRAMDLWDADRYAGGAQRSPRATLPRVRAVGIRSDILYYPDEVREVAGRLAALGYEADYRELDSPHGHDAFLIEAEATGRCIAELLEEAVAAPAAAGAS